MTGSMPRWVDVIVEDELCDRVKCGDRVRIWGVYRAACIGLSGTISGTTRTVFIANNIEPQSNGKRLARGMPSTDTTSFFEFSRCGDTLGALARSFAPSLCGLLSIKKGLVLQLAGGGTRQLGNGHRIRGDIHVLLIGDPSCGKSQLLRYVLAVSPQSISATGRGSSGVGLTAAVIRDPDTGENRVEGGAMVMADGHVVCIDEFDKMHVTDRVAIHEVMEQQTVTIAKAGIHAVLNARCSVLAAANPVYGSWSAERSLSAQIVFEEALMSRFDLIYVVRDSETLEKDERIANSVLRNISSTAKPSRDILSKDDLSVTIQPQEFKEVAEPEFEGIFQPRHEMIFFDDNEREYQVLNPDFMRRYLHYIRHVFYAEKQANFPDDGWGPFPLMSEEAEEAMVELYVELRNRASLGEARLVHAVTARSLEGVARLATAHARIRLHKYVSRRDVAVVKELVLASLFEEPPSGKPVEDFSDDEEMVEMAEEAALNPVRQGPTRDPVQEIAGSVQRAENAQYIAESVEGRENASETAESGHESDTYTQELDYNPQGRAETLPHAGPRKRRPRASEVLEGVTEAVEQMQLSEANKRPYFEADARYKTFCLLVPELLARPEAADGVSIDNLQAYVNNRALEMDPPTPAFGIDEFMRHLQKYSETADEFTLFIDRQNSMIHIC